jgi:hypothetical protein
MSWPYPFATNDYTAFAIEQSMEKKWKSQWTTHTALLACIKDRDFKFRKGYTPQGLAAIIPLMYADMTNPPAGVADASELTADTPQVTNGFTQALYQFTHLRRGMTLRSSEKVITKNGARGNLLEGKVTQLSSSFKNVIANQIEGTAVDSRTTLMGIQYATALANVVGTIDQSSGANSWWRAQVSNVGGVISLPVIDNLYDQITQYAAAGNEDDGSVDSAAPDLFLLGYSNTVNVYGKVRELIAPAERIVNAEFKAKYGLMNFMYLGMKCVQSNRLASGTANLLTTSTWLWGGNDQPQQDMPIRLPGTDAEERYFNMWNFLGCDEVRRNGYFYGITG